MWTTSLGMTAMRRNTVVECCPWAEEVGLTDPWVRWVTAHSSLKRFVTVEHLRGWAIVIDTLIFEQPANPKRLPLNAGGLHSRSMKPKCFRHMTFWSGCRGYLCLLHFAWSHAISGIYPGISVIPDSDCFMTRVKRQEGFHAAFIELEKTWEDVLGCRDSSTWAWVSCCHSCKISKRFWPSGSGPALRKISARLVSDSLK